MTICYFGIYDPGYSRNKALIRGLKQNGVQVIECRSSKSGIRKYLDLIMKHSRIRNGYDAMVVGFPGFQCAVLAKILARKPIIFDAFVSLYDSNVFDRKITPKKSLKAGYYWFLDWLSCRLADKVLLDTNEHISFFADTFKIKENKLYRIFVGADSEVFYPRGDKNKESVFQVHFHGYFIPLQGVRHIIKAAEILRNEEIVFNIVGRGQEFKEIEDLVGSSGLMENINLIEPVELEKLPDLITQADICLGIFGDTQKTKRVIPNKVFECIAMGRPVITADTPAVRELFSEKEIMLCRAADGKDLAEKIMTLKNDNDLRSMLALNGRRLFEEKLNEATLAKQLLKIINKD